jgi:hypothetical protein
MSQALLADTAVVPAQEIHRVIAEAMYSEPDQSEVGLVDGGWHQPRFDTDYDIMAMLSAPPELLVRLEKNTFQDFWWQTVRGDLMLWSLAALDRDEQSHDTFALICNSICEAFAGIMGSDEITVRRVLSQLGLCCLSITSFGGVGRKRHNIKLSSMAKDLIENNQHALSSAQWHLIEAVSAAVDYTVGARKAVDAGYDVLLHIVEAQIIDWTRNGRRQQRRQLEEKIFDKVAKLIRLHVNRAPIL